MVYLDGEIEGSSGKDVFHGYAETTFVREDGTQLGSKCTFLSPAQHYTFGIINDCTGS